MIARASAVDPPDVAIPSTNLVQSLVLARAQAVTDALVDVRDDYDLESKEDMDNAVELVRAIKQWHGEIDAERESLTQPLYRIQKWINDLFRPVLSNLAGKEVRLKAMIGAYARREQERQRQLLAAAAAQAQQAKTQEEYRAVVGQAVIQVANAPPVPQGISVGETWTFELLDEDAVPLEFKSVDAAKVKVAIKAGAREIPGLRIFSEARVSVRQK